MNLDSELSAAKTALEAAGIEAQFPADADAVDEDLRPLFCWVLREGVTNVIRHSNAKRCWVEFESRQLRVRDDGTQSVPRGPSGNGLKGLTERATEAGATLSVARGSGGFSLTVGKAAR
jgi:two-component system sensor histidine kinase DesK